jgi:ABC-type polysaccharide/polyol phosphate export permease
MARIPPEERVRVYKAGASSVGLFNSLSMAWEELCLSRYIIWRIFTRDFAAQFRQRLLGYFWAVLGPLVSVVSFVFMYQTGILNPGDVKVPYAIYVFFGNSLWGIMIGAFTNVSAGLLGNAELVLRTSIPKFALAIAGLSNLVYAMLVQLIILVILLVVFRVMPSWGILLYPLMAIPLIILGIGLGLILAVIGTVARDITNMASTLLGLVMYITPVIYVTDFDSHILKAVVQYNPLTYIFQMSREVAFEGNFAHWGGFALAWLFALVVLVLGVHGFYLIKDKAAERL